MFLGGFRRGAGLHNQQQRKSAEATIAQRQAAIGDAAAQAAKVNPKHICLEIPDAIDMESQSQAGSALGELKTMGFKLSIDNFGINNFNLLQLSKTPIDVLKIDKSFVEDVSLNEKSISIIRCVINKVIAPFNRLCCNVRSRLRINIALNAIDERCNFFGYAIV